MRKVDNGGKQLGKTGKIMTFIVAANVVANRPPKCQLIETSTASANYPVFLKWKNTCIGQVKILDRIYR